MLLKRSININDRVRGDQLRVLDDEGNMLGVLTRLDALDRARIAGKDLVEVAAAAVPPVAKIIDFNKYLYELAKKEKGTKKSSTETKEVKISLFIAENDMNRLAARASEFLREGHQVRVSLWLKGRELGKKEQARASLISFINKIERAKPMNEIALQGKVLRVVVSLDKTK